MPTPAQLGDRAAHRVTDSEVVLDFENIGEAWGLDRKAASFGAAIGDLDGDHDLDIVVNERWFENTGTPERRDWPAHPLGHARTPDIVHTGDVDRDGRVDPQDLRTLFSSWGPCANCDDCPADFTGDCVVSTLDLIILLHQLLFQGMFAIKNITLRRKLGQPIRGDNPEAS